MQKVPGNGAWLIVTVVIAACSGASTSTSLPPITPGPTASASTTTPTTAQPTPAVTPAAPEPTDTPAGPVATVVPACGPGAPATTFEPDSIVCVVAGPLRVRSKPSTADDSAKFEPLRENGQLLFVIDGPTAGSGYSWYLVQDAPGALLGSASGWIAAAAKDGTPWLSRATVTCPAAPTLRVLAAIDPVVRIHCYHDREFTFTDLVVGGPMCGDGGGFKSPTWMAGCLSTAWWGGPNSGLVVAIPPALAPKAGEFEPDVEVRATITAHMDDPAALTCMPYEGIEGDYALINPGTVLGCRGMFVATSFQRVAP